MSSAAVTVEGERVGAINTGFMVLLGVEEGDTASDADYMVDKISGLRVFEDDEGKMNLPLGAVDGEVLLVSQFTLIGDCRKGRRPSFVRSAPFGLAEELYLRVASGLRDKGHRVETGVFRAEMSVGLTNEGPVTLLLDSRKGF